jgi:hypothetical protein
VGRDETYRSQDVSPAMCWLCLGVSEYEHDGPKPHIATSTMCSYMDYVARYVQVCAMCVIIAQRDAAWVT